MKIRSLHAGELDALYDLLAVSYLKEGADQGALRVSFKAVIESDPYFDLDLNRVLEVDGKLAARIGIYDRRMFFNGRILRVGAIGGVCTAPEYRGRGYVRQLLEDSTQRMRERGFDFSLLFGEPAIYGKSGWQTLSAFGMATNFNLAARSAAAPAREGDPVRDAAWLARIYEATSARLSGPFQRAPEYWRTWIARQIRQKDYYRLRIVGGADRPSGYFVWKGADEICEMGWEQEQPGALAAVARAIFADRSAPELKFRFFLQELFDYIADNSAPPTLEEMRRQKYYIRKEALYCGLFKLISDKLEMRTTDSLLARLRASNHVFWDMDHF